MAFPAGWPPRPAASSPSLRVFLTGTCSANYPDNAFLFADNAAAYTVRPLPYVKPGSTAPVSIGDIYGSGSPMGTGVAVQDVAPPSHENPPATQQAVPHPMVWSNGIRVVNEGTGDIEISFDGTHTHGYIVSTKEVIYLNRREAGIAVRGVAGATPDFTIEAW